MLAGVAAGAHTEGSAQGAGASTPEEVVEFLAACRLVDEVRLERVRLGTRVTLRRAIGPARPLAS